MCKTFLIALALLLLATPAAGADEALTAIDRAKADYQKKNYLGAVEALRAALDAAWLKAPLTARNVQFVTDRPKGYGYYEPRTGDVFETIEPTLLYCEILGYTAKKEGDFYKFAISADFAVKDDKGQVLGGQKNFHNWESRSRSFNTELMMFFTFNFKGLPKGKYALMITLYDKNSSKTAVIEKAFAIK